MQPQAYNILVITCLINKFKLVASGYVNVSNSKTVRSLLFYTRINNVMIVLCQIKYALQIIQMAHGIMQSRLVPTKTLSRINERQWLTF